MRTFASFFAGIGGFDLGFESAGMSCVFQCEVNKFCTQILTQHWKSVPKKGDIKEVKIADVPYADVWCGGFPCQDVSVARMGPRVGLRGKRSGLFFEYAQLLGERRPRVFVLENVPGLLSSHGGRDFGVVIKTLADLGYSVGWRVLNSRHFGVPQSRQRVYVVGCHRDRGGPGQILFESERREGSAAENRQNGKKALSSFEESIGDIGEGPIVAKTAYCLYACSARHTGTDWSRNYVSYREGRVRRLLPIECERLQGFPDGWTIPEHLLLDSEKLETLRYTALGNAVTVPVAKWLGTRILSYLDESQERRDIMSSSDVEAQEIEDWAAGRDLAEAYLQI